MDRLIRTSVRWLVLGLLLLQVEAFYIPGKPALSIIRCRCSL